MESMEPKDKADEVAEHGRGNLGRLVAITVAVVAVLLTLAKIKDEKLVERMLAAQVQQLDQWNYYQAKSIKQHLYQLQVDQWQLQQRAGLTTPAGQAAVGAQVARWQSEVKRYGADKAKTQADAEAAGHQYERLERQVDRLHFTEALMSLGIALLAVASLANNRSLYWLAVLFSAAGFVLGVPAMVG